MSPSSIITGSIQDADFCVMGAEISSLKYRCADSLKTVTLEWGIASLEHPFLLECLFIEIARKSDLSNLHSSVFSIEIVGNLIIFLMYLASDFFL